VSNLSRKQIAALTFINEHQRQQGYSPNLEQISLAIGCNGRASAHRHVSALIERGYVRRIGRLQLQVIKLPPLERFAAPSTEALAKATDDELYSLRRDLALEITRRTNAKAIARADALMEAR
jgi:SOS-response transcriptional repressor LexA